MHAKRLGLFALSALLLIAILLPGQAQPAYAIQNATVGIYNGTGTWADGITAIENFSDHEGIGWTTVSANDINTISNLSSYITLLWIPGGYAANYNSDITTSGDSHIRSFVNGGGKIIGTCAGEYFLADRIAWEGVNCNYPMNLFKGRINGSLHDIIPWAGYTNTTIDLDANNPINSGFPSSLTMVYYGGGDIWPYTGQTVSWVGSYNVTNTKGIAAFSYGQGTALIMGPHPEIGLIRMELGIRQAVPALNGPGWPAR
ncbi:BPL-N domain-containing protein [Ferviditalea candida]|uniref:BPL-N domain-containing protein n=1 Tax=Ferviditalea candida TaxID=3108399 RepID=A0ABU5ZI39_9BACL|nr:BPL-N domain-containing protein [Paenibacillaceae bacterium T2]